MENRSIGTVLNRIRRRLDLCWNEFLFKLFSFSYQYFCCLRMKLLETTKQLLVWLCMCPPDSSASKSRKLSYLTVSMAIFLINFGCTLSGFMYVYKSTDVKGSLFAFMASSATLVVLYTMTSAYQLRFKINQLFENLSVICTSGRCSD